MPRAESDAFGENALCRTLWECTRVHGKTSGYVLFLQALSDELPHSQSLQTVVNLAICHSHL